jgi:hypothetical protein
VDGVKPRTNRPLTFVCAVIQALRRFNFSSITPKETSAHSSKSCSLKFSRYASTSQSRSGSLRKYATNSRTIDFKTPRSSSTVVQIPVRQLGHVATLLSLDIPRPYPSSQSLLAKEVTTARLHRSFDFIPRRIEEAKPTDPTLIKSLLQHLNRAPRRKVPHAKLRRPSPRVGKTLAQRAEQTDLCDRSVAHELTNSLPLEWRRHRARARTHDLVALRQHLNLQRALHN